MDGYSNYYIQQIFKATCKISLSGVSQNRACTMQDIVGRNPLGQEVVPPQQDMSPDIEPRVDQATLQEKIKTHPPTIQIFISYKGLVQHTLTR
jgi:hypothetical protein